MRGLTAVSGLRVGHAEVEGGRSGSTVVLGPFRAAVHVPGMATGTRELHTLAPEHLVPRADAIVLTGGSAFGLAAADGVMRWMAERGLGYDNGIAIIPIVPAAVLFDLRDGVPRPDGETGAAACEAATDGPVAEGRVGAGAGATVGKLGGIDRASPGGLGSADAGSGEYTVAALTAVNALGDVLDGGGQIVAGSRRPEGGYHDGRVLLREGGARSRPPGTNTTLCVVATDAPLGRIDLSRLARMAATALARRIRPVHTPFDGDVVFAVSPTGPEETLPRPELLRLGEAATAVLEEAIERAVRSGS